MTYTAFDPAAPTTAQTRQEAITSILQNGLALRDACAIGEFPGYNYSKYLGTAEQPAIILFRNGTQQIKAELTWGSSGGSDGNVTIAIWSSSTNNGSSWSTIGTCTYAYDSAGNLNTTSWS